MTPNNMGISSQPGNPSIRSQPKPYRRSRAGTKRFSRIPTLVTQRRIHGLETETINKPEASNRSEQQQITITTVQKSQRIVYKADFLKSIKCKVDHDQRYRLLHPNICSTVRKLKLNKKNKKTSRGNNGAPSVNFDNLIKIKCTRSKYIYNMSTKIKLTTINIQSLKSKELTLIEHLGSSDADMCVVTETWLNDDDEVWLQGSEFNKNGWKCYNINRQGR